MKMIAVVLACVVTSLLCACAAPTAVTPASAAAAIANLQTQTAKQCVVIQPFLSSMTIMNQSNPAAVADLKTASDTVGKVCAAFAPTSGAAATFSLTDIQAAVNTGVPALLKVVGASSLSPDQKTAAQLAITAAQLAISEALSNVAPAATAPASVPLAA